MKKNNILDTDADHFRSQLVKQAADASALPAIVAEYIKQIKAKSAANMVKPQEKNTEESTLPPVIEYTQNDLKEAHLEAINEFTGKIRSNPSLKSASRRIFKMFLDNFEGAFIWGKSTVNSENRLNEAIELYVEATDSTLAVCTIVPRSVQFDDDDNEIVTIIQGQYPHLAIRDYPLTKIWAAILIMQKMALVYLYHVLFRDMKDERLRGEMAYIMSYYAMMDLIEHYLGGKQYLSLLLQMIGKRKITDIKKLAEVLRSDNLSKKELADFEALFETSDINRHPVVGLNQVRFHTNCLVSAFLMTKVKNLPEGDKTARIVELFREMQSHMKL